MASAGCAWVTAAALNALLELDTDEMPDLIDGGDTPPTSEESYQDVPQPQTPPELIEFAERSKRTPGLRKASRSRSARRATATEVPQNGVKTEAGVSQSSAPSLHMTPGLQSYQGPIMEEFGCDREERFANGLQYTPIQEALGVGMGSCVLANRVRT